MSSLSFVFIATVLSMTCWISVQSQTLVTQQEADQIVAMHNAARAAVSPAASNMMQMSWDPQLATSAQNYANTCPSGHSGIKGLGENLSWGWPAMLVTKAITMWTDERPFYTYSSNSSTKVGCGKKTCSSLMGHGKGDAWVCHYSPAGNWVGQLPYKTGAPCSQCPTGSTCIQNQCSVSGSGGAPGQPSAPVSPTPAPVSPASSPITPLPANVPTTLTSGSVVVPIIQTPNGPMVPITITKPQQPAVQSPMTLPTNQA